MVGTDLLLPIIERPNVMTPTARPEPREELRPWQTPDSRVATELLVFADGPRSHIVYAPLRRLAFRANATMVNLLADLQEGVEVSMDAATAEFLHGLRLIDVRKDPLPAKKSKGEFLPTSVTLFLTTACNLRCTYCYASAGETPHEMMTLATARKAIDFVVANALRVGEREIEIRYHGGGEPTVNWHTMTESFAYAKTLGERHGLAVSGSSASNGVLSPAQIDWIVANMRGVNLSWDGLPEVQDEQRPTAGGGNSSGRIEATIDEFNRRQYPYGIRVTVTNRSLPVLTECVEYICERVTCPLLHIEPAFQVGRCGKGQALPPEIGQFVDQFRRAQTVADAFGIELYYSGARIDQVTAQFCGAVGDSFSISAAGNVSACYEVFSEQDPRADIFFYGAYDEADGRYQFDYDRLNRLRQRTVHHLPECADCLCKWHCAGDCMAKAAMHGPIERGAPTDRCHINIELTKDELTRRIDESGGFLWVGEPDRLAFDSCSI